MSKLRIGILIALTALLLFVAIFFWGSIASALSVLGLFLIPGTLAYRMIWIDREDRVVDDMDPMNIIFKSHLDSVGKDEE